MQAGASAAGLGQAAASASSVGQTAAGASSIGQTSTRLGQTAAGAPSSSQARLDVIVPEIQAAESSSDLLRILQDIDSRAQNIASPVFSLLESAERLAYLLRHRAQRQLQVRVQTVCTDSQAREESTPNKHEDDEDCKNAQIGTREDSAASPSTNDAVSSTNDAATSSADDTRPSSDGPTGAQRKCPSDSATLFSQGVPVLTSSPEGVKVTVLKRSNKFIDDLATGFSLDLTTNKVIYSGLDPTTSRAIQSGCPTFYVVNVDPHLGLLTLDPVVVNAKDLMRPKATQKTSNSDVDPGLWAAGAKTLNGSEVEAELRAVLDLRTEANVGSTIRVGLQAQSGTETASPGLTTDSQALATTQTRSVSHVSPQTRPGPQAGSSVQDSESQEYLGTLTVSTPYTDSQTQSGIQYGLSSQATHFQTPAQSGKHTGSTPHADAQISSTSSGPAKQTAALTGHSSTTTTPWPESIPTDSEMGSEEGAELEELEMGDTTSSSTSTWTQSAIQTGSSSQDVDSEIKAQSGTQTTSTSQIESRAPSEMPAGSSSQTPHSQNHEQSRRQTTSTPQPDSQISPAPSDLDKKTSALTSDSSTTATPLPENIPADSEMGSEEEAGFEGLEMEHTTSASTSKGAQSELQAWSSSRHSDVEAPLQLGAQSSSELQTNIQTQSELQTGSSSQTTDSETQISQTDPHISSTLSSVEENTSASTQDTSTTSTPLLLLETISASFDTESEQGTAVEELEMEESTQATTSPGTTKPSLANNPLWMDLTSNNQSSLNITTADLAEVLKILLKDLTFIGNFGTAPAEGGIVRVLNLDTVSAGSTTV